jgi:hypothetical protein
MVIWMRKMMAWSNGCVRSECQHVHSTSGLHFPPQRLLACASRSQSSSKQCVGLSSHVGQACAVVSARGMWCAGDFLTMRPLIQRELSCRSRRFRVSLTTILARERLIGRRAGSAYG